MVNYRGLKTSGSSLEDIYQPVLDCVVRLNEKMLKEVSAIKVFRFLMDTRPRRDVLLPRKVYTLVKESDDITLDFTELLEKFVYVTVHLISVDDEILICVDSLNDKYYEALRELGFFVESQYDPDQLLWQLMVNGDGVFTAPVVCSMNDSHIESIVEDLDCDDFINDSLIREDTVNAYTYIIQQRLLHDPALYEVDFEEINRVVSEIVSEFPLPEVPLIRFNDTVRSVEPMHVDVDTINQARRVLLRRV